MNKLVSRKTNGLSCTSNHECIDILRCSNNMCSCNSTKKYWDDSKCGKFYLRNALYNNDTKTLNNFKQVIKSLYNQPCKKSDDECFNDSGLICMNQVCKCNDNYFWNGTNCGKWRIILIKFCWYWIINITFVSRNC